MNARPTGLSPSLAAPIERGERRPVRLSGHAVLDDGTRFNMTLVDLSYDGCGIECPVTLKPGAGIRLAVVQRGAINAKVRWYSGGKAGLMFEPEPEAAKGRQPRRTKRVAVTAVVTLRRHGRQNFQVQVFDASSHGCKVEFVERPETKECVWVRFEGLEPLEARVRWLDGHCAGLEFSRPIHPAVFDLMAERLRQGQ